MQVLKVALMYPRHRLARPLQALRQAGMAAQGCTTQSELLAMLQDEPCDVVVLDIAGLDEDGLLLVANLRHASRMGIVVSGQGLDTTGRIRALQSGADICLVDETDDRELVLLLLALGRRLAWAQEQSPPSRGPADGQWELRDQDWTLTDPHRRVFPLSANERILVRTLWRVKGRTVSRNELADALLQDGGRNRELGPRSVDVLVSRLRRRLAREGSMLPIRTVYGSGYLFVDD